jgi:hypothetical protein
MTLTRGQLFQRAAAAALVAAVPKALLKAAPAAAAPELDVVAQATRLGDLEASQLRSTLVVRGGHDLRTGDIVRNERTGELMRVLGLIEDRSLVLVERGLLHTVRAIGADDPGLIIASAVGAGAELRRPDHQHVWVEDRLYPRAFTIIGQQPDGKIAFSATAAAMRRYDRKHEQPAVGRYSKYRDHRIKLVHETTAPWNDCRSFEFVWA